MAGMAHGDNYNGFFRQLLFVAFLILVGLVIFNQLQFFVGSLLGALTLYVVFRGILFRLVEKWKWAHWAAGLMLMLVCLVILGGLGYMTFTVIAKQIPAINTSRIMASFAGLVDSVNEKAGFTVLNDSAIQRSGSLLAKVLTRVLNTTYSFAINIFLMLVIVYFMFTAGRKMECYISRYAPFKGRSLCLLKSEMKHMVYSNAIGIPLIMIIQTAVSGLIYWLMGLENYIFWGFITAICGLVPLVGTALVYVPMGIYFAAAGDVWGGIIIILYGVLVISNTDNLIRIVVMKKVGDTHPLIVIFGVILGIPLFGFWGIIFGPLLVSGFLLLIKIYYMEYGLLSDSDDAAETAETDDITPNIPPVKSIDDLHAMKALKMLKTARIYKPSRKGGRGKNSCPDE